MTDTGTQKQCYANWSSWRWQLANILSFDKLKALRDAKISALGLVDHTAVCGVDFSPEAFKTARRYPVALTPYWLNLCARSAAIAMQTFPDPRELSSRLSGDLDDPFSEVSAPPVPGLVHRFADRVLLIATTACPMRCRHCTRKNLLASHLPMTPATLELQLQYIKAHPSVREVIISGGDPLLLPDETLISMVEKLCSLAQIDAVRIGSRAPCTLPMRITPELARGLAKTKRVWLNTQFNHVDEITEEAVRAAELLVDAGIPVSCQTVLLAGINDSADALTALLRKLQRHRIRPYYAFAGDQVNGTAHFRVDMRRARQLEDETARRLGGLALPRFVADIPGSVRKTPV